MSGAAPGLIRTPDQRLRIFVSSTLRELAQERRAARAAIERLALAPVMFELGARPHPPRSLYRAYLEQSDVFIGIYWESYGWVAPGEAVSGIEDEYMLAPDVPMLIYVKESDQRDPRLERLLDRVREDDRVSYVTFTTAVQLRRLLISDLATLLAERFTVGADRTRSLPAPARLVGATTLVPPPPTLTRLIGRQDELTTLTRVFADDGCRVVTLTGPGGIGKTRLALAATRDLEPLFPDGVAFVDLAPVRDAGAVLAAIAAALGIRDTAIENVGDAITRALDDQRILLVLDNAEHVVEAAGQLAQLVSRTTASMLVTSRVLLRIDGERNVAVEGLTQDAAIELFAERARSMKPDFELTDSNRADVAAICSAVDEVPLAVELAAARIRVLRPVEIAERLHETLSLPVDGRRDRPERQRTMRSTIDWSVALLEPAERELFTRLGVFRTGFALDAVECVNSGQAQTTTLQSLSALVDGSLVQEHDRGTRTWFTMLSSVREYAREELDSLGETPECRERHAAFYLRLAAAAAAEIIGPRQEAWMSRLTDESNELTAAMEFLLDNRRWENAVDLVWALDWYWGIAGRLLEVSGWMQRILDDGTDASERARMIARVEVVFIGVWRRPDQASMPELNECATYFQAHGDHFSEARARIGIGWVQLHTSPPDLDAAEQSFQRAGHLFDVVDAAYGRAVVGLMLGNTHLRRGDILRATETLDACISHSSEIGDHLLAGSLRNARGWAALLGGDVSTADDCFRQQILIASTIGHEHGIAYALEGCFAVAATAGHIERAGKLLGAAETIRERKGNARAVDTAIHAAIIREIEESSESNDFARARTGGRSFATASAVEYALARDEVHQLSAGQASDTES